MEKDKMHILRLLTAIEDNGSVSQRELSMRLNISLGLINLFVKRLISQGYFDVMIRPSKKTTYTLTPKGISERACLTLEYFDHSLEYYREIRNHIRSKLSELEKEQVKDVILYGMGELTELTYICMQNSPVNLLGVVDGGPIEQKSFFGFQIHSPDYLLDMPGVAVLITTLESCEEKKAEIRRKGGNERPIYDLMCFQRSLLKRTAESCGV
ncbi:MAG: winged helix-turn-helix transcriptional regulator [Pseudomonadota bacterium]